jgi:hypothetical protein
MTYFTAYVFLLAIVNFMFTCGYSAMGSHKLAIATGATTAGCCFAGLVSLIGLPS